MSLDHAILGFLQYLPLSGYDLKARFDLSVQHFWPADQSQIYRTLAKLAEQGFARLEVVEQDRRPHRKVYHITPAGREELHRWLAAPVDRSGGRNASLVQVFFSGQLSDGELLSTFRGAAERAREQLQQLRQVPVQAHPFTAQINAPREAWCWFLTLECGLRMAEANLTWLEDVITRIERGEMPTREAKEVTPCIP